MKKILLMTFEYPTGKAYCGGVGQVVRQCREGLVELGHEVYVLISSEFQKKKPVKLLLPDGSIMRFSNFHAFQKKYPWDVFSYIIQHFVNWTRDLQKIKKHKGQRPRIIYHFHSLLRREQDSGFSTFNRFLFNQEKMIHVADRVVCPSRYEYDNFMRYFPYCSEKATLLENTVELFPVQKEKIEDMRSRYKIKRNDIVALYIGRLEKIKGADLLIKYIPRVLQKHRNLKLFMVGKTLERHIYRKLLNVKKRFPRQLFYINYLKKEELFQFYYMSDIYLNTSLSESFSLSTHEGALCDNALFLNSLPVFDKFKGAAVFFSNQNKNGNGFVSRFEYLLKHRKIRETMSIKAKRIAKRFMTENSLKQDLSSLLKS